MDLRVEVLQHSDGLKAIGRVPLMFSTARSVYMDLRVEVLQLGDGLEDNERVPVEVLHGPERVGIDCASKSGSTLTASKTSGRCLSKFSTARACWHRLAR